MHRDALWQFGEAVTTDDGRGSLREAGPCFQDARTLRGQHAVLEAVEALAVDGREELAGEEAEDDAGREVVLVDPMTQLEILVEYGSQRQRDRLHGSVLSSIFLSILRFAGSDDTDLEHYVRRGRGIIGVDKMRRRSG